MTENSLLNTSICEGVEKGTCVMLVDGQIVYAGPIKGSPFAGGKLVLLNAADFESLKEIVDRRRH